MSNFKKLFMWFFAASMLATLFSIPEDGMVTFDRVTDWNNEAHLIDSDDLDFYSIGSRDAKTVQPVVKIIFAVEMAFLRTATNSATGFSVAYDKSEDVSYIVTNDHFCEHHEELTSGTKFLYQNHRGIISPEGSPDLKELTVYRRDKSKDLCLMSAQGYVRPAKVASPKYKVRQMEKVTTIGSPAGVFPVLLETHISNMFSREVAPKSMHGGRNLYLLSEQVFAGQSGSPVYNSEGEVIGVIFMSLSNRSGPVYGGVAIPLLDLIEFLDDSKIKY